MYAGQDMKTLKECHPNWFQATDYRWLEHEKRPGTVDYSLWNRLDDINRRDMASWDGGDPEDYPAGEF